MTIALPESIAKYSEHFERLQEFQKTHINTKPRIWAAIIVAVIVLNMLVAAVLFFLFANPLDEGVLSPDGKTVTFQGEISIPTLAAVAELEEAGTTLDSSTGLLSDSSEIGTAIAEASDVDFSVHTRSTRGVITYPIVQVSSYRSAVTYERLSSYAVNSYMAHLARYEDFWLLTYTEDANSFVANLVKSVDDLKIVRVRVEYKELATVTVTYTLYDYGAATMSFARLWAINGFLSDYGLSTNALLTEHGGVNPDSIGAWLSTVGDTLGDMSPEEVAEFNRSALSFAWSLVLASLSVVGPLTVIAVVRFAYNAKKTKDELEETLPTIRERCKEFSSKCKDVLDGNIKISELIQSGEECEDEQE